MPQTVYSNVIQALIMGKPIVPHLSVSANKFILPENHRYCPYCVEDDYDMYGVSYWHTEHQIPGVQICAKHNCYLQKQRKRRRLFALPRNNDKSSKNILRFDEKISCFSNQIFRRKNHFDLELTLSAYRSQLRKLDLITKAGRIRARQFYSLIINNLLKTSIYHQVCSFLKPNGHYLFPQALFYKRTHDLNYCTFKHVLIMSSLFDCFSDFEATYGNTDREVVAITESEREDEKPLSSQKVCSLYKKLKSVRKVSRIMGVSFITVKRILKESRIRVPTKPSKIMYSLERLATLKLLKGYKTSEIAKFFKVSQGAIEQMLSQHQFITRTRKELRFRTKLNQHRGVLLALMKKHRKWTIKSVRQAAGSSFIWMYKNDKEWLYSKLPSATPRNLRKTLINQ
jgi:transposase